MNPFSLRKFFILIFISYLAIGGECDHYLENQVRISEHTHTQINRPLDEFIGENIFDYSDGNELLETYSSIKSTDKDFKIGEIRFTKNQIKTSNTSAVPYERSSNLNNYLIKLIKNGLVSKKDLFRLGILSVYDHIKNIRNGLNLSRFDFLKDLPFKIIPENSEISLLAEGIIKKSIIDDDINHFIYKRELNQRNSPQMSNQEEVVIIGAGPVALITAIKALENGKKVTILEKRTSYARENILGMNAEFLNWLEKTTPSLKRYMKALGIFLERPGWKDLGATPGNTFYSIRTQQLENALSLYLEQFKKLSKEEDALKIIRGANVDKIIKNDSGYQVDYVHEAKEFTLEDKKLVVGIDGARGKSSKAMNMKIQKTTNSHWTGLAFFKMTPEQTLLFTDKFNKINLREIMKNNPHKEKVLKQLQVMGWNKDEFPAVRFFQNGSLLYMASEIPRNIGPQLRGQTESAIAARDRWFEEIKNLLVPEEFIGKVHHFRSDPPTNTLDFEPQALEQFSVKIQNNENNEGAFLFVGDSAVTPHFMLRSGVNSGFKHAEILEETVFQADNIATGIEKFEKKMNVVVKKSLDLLVAKNYFKDAPFLRSLNQKEKETSKILESIFSENPIGYRDYIEPLLLAGFDPKNQKEYMFLELYQNKDLKKTFESLLLDVKNFHGN